MSLKDMVVDSCEGAGRGSMVVHPRTMITTPQMAAIVMVLARAVVISSSNFESHGWKHVVATRDLVVVD